MTLSFTARFRGRDLTSTPERHWIELFNDLIMVAMLSNLSHVFELGGRGVDRWHSMAIMAFLANVDQMGLYGSRVPRIALLKW